MGAVRQRLRDLLEEKGISASALARLTGDQAKNVQRYLSEGEKARTETIPADFIGRCETNGFASARYLLTGEGSPDVVKPDVREMRLHVAGRVINGDVDALLPSLATPPAGAHLADAIEDADPLEDDEGRGDGGSSAA